MWGGPAVRSGGQAVRSSDGRAHGRSDKRSDRQSVKRSVGGLSGGCWGGRADGRASDSTHADHKPHSSAEGGDSARPPRRPPATAPRRDIFATRALAMAESIGGSAPVRRAEPEERRAGRARARDADDAASSARLFLGRGPERRRLPVVRRRGRGDTARPAWRTRSPHLSPGLAPRASKKSLPIRLRARSESTRCAKLLEPFSKNRSSAARTWRLARCIPRKWSNGPKWPTRAKLTAAFSPEIGLRRRRMANRPRHQPPKWSKTDKLPGISSTNRGSVVRKRRFDRVYMFRLLKYLNWFTLVTC